MPKVLEIEDVEVLVHISASCNTESEALWRRLAKSYLNFEPISRRKIEIFENQLSFQEENQKNVVNISFEKVNASHIETQPVRNHKKRITYYECTKPNKSNDSVFDINARNENSLMLGRYLTEGGTHLSQDTERGSSPSSRISSYKLSYSQDNCFDLENTQENDPEGLNSDMGKIQILGHGDRHGSNFGPEKNTLTQEALAITETSISSRQRVLNAEEDKSTLDLSLRCNLTAKTDEKQSCIEPLDLKDKGKNKFTIFSSDDKALVISKVTQSMKMGKWSKALEIRSPPPPIGNSSLCLEDLITQPLRKLAERGSLERNFIPTESKRDLQPTERGYWCVICTTWDMELRIRCWNCLGTYIEKDNSAGWGVWCVRDENFEFIRIYSWGIIIGHIYLLLRMASEGKVSKTGASWIDADGQEIIKICSKT